MLDLIAEAEQRFREIDVLLSSPESHERPEEIASLLKERKRLLPIVEKFQIYLRAENAFRESSKILDEEDDVELRQLAASEAEEAADAMRQLQKELQLLLLSSDPNDDRNVIVEIRAGAGGEEAALFAADLYRMYTMFADQNGFSVEPLEIHRTELGGLRIVSFLISGENAYARLKHESGVHRVQRIPVTESQGRIQTSTVTVAVLAEAEEVEIEIAPTDIRFETCKSSGAGGQHINKTESAVRLTHIPSGLVIECQEERSQFKNRDKAMRLLKAKLLESSRRAQEESIAKDRRSQVGTGDRSERIRTYNYPQGRVTDHRIGLTLHRLPAILNGDLTELLDALRAKELAVRLRDRSADT